MFSDDGYDPSKYKTGGLYDLTYTSIEGTTQCMEKYRGHVLLITNVASNCNLTSINYKQLTELYEKYGESDGLRILAFPCNQFGNKEPKSDKDIKDFASSFNVKFDMSAKIYVNGKDTHPVWAFLKEQKPGIFGSFIKWNFTKFLVDKHGKVVKRYSPFTNPERLEKDLVHCFKEGSYRGIMDFTWIT